MIRFVRGDRHHTETGRRNTQKSLYIQADEHNIQYKYIARVSTPGCFGGSWILISKCELKFILFNKISRLNNVTKTRYSR